MVTSLIPKPPLDNEALFKSIKAIPAVSTEASVSLPDGTAALLLAAEDDTSPDFFVQHKGVMHRWTATLGGSTFQKLLNDSNKSAAEVGLTYSKELSGDAHLTLAQLCGPLDIDAQLAITSFKLWRWQWARARLNGIFVSGGISPVYSKRDAIACMYAYRNGWLSYTQFSELAQAYGASVKADFVGGALNKILWLRPPKGAIAMWCAGASGDATYQSPIPPPATVKAPTAPVIKSSLPKLTDSVGLGALVQGTATPYRVVLVNGCSGGRMAARTVFNGSALSKVSFRVESPLLSTLSGSVLGNMLEVMGFDVKGGYASTHLTDVPIKLAMAYGAFVEALSYRSEHTAASLSLRQLIEFNENI
jgi:hypothetical protein